MIRSHISCITKSVKIDLIIWNPSFSFPSLHTMCCVSFIV
jgi:hypothetical protein